VFLLITKAVWPPNLSIQVRVQFRDEFSCIVSFVLEYLQHLCGLEDKTQTYTRPGPSEAGTRYHVRYPWTYQMVLALLHGLLN